MNLIPLGHRVLIQPIEITEKVATETGVTLYKPAKAVDMEKAGVDMGYVVALGTTAYCDERLGGQPWIKVGDKVAWARYAGKPIDGDDGITYHVINDEDILVRYGD